MSPGLPWYKKQTLYIKTGHYKKNANIPHKKHRFKNQQNVKFNSASMKRIIPHDQWVYPEIHTDQHLKKNQCNSPYLQITQETTYDQFKRYRESTSQNPRVIHDFLKT